MRIEPGAAKLCADCQSPLTTASVMAVVRCGKAAVLVVAAAAPADGTMPASRRSVSLPGRARRRELSAAISLRVTAVSSLRTGSATLAAHNGRCWVSTRGNGLLLVAALAFCLDNWRISTSCRPIPPPSRDMLTASCWSYICWYCLVVSVLSGLSLASTSLAERIDLSISLRNSDSNSWATLRRLASLSRSPTFNELSRLRSV
ncbi:hypothetical protein D3C76_1164650 [compost metagenome]